MPELPLEEFQRRNLALSAVNGEALPELDDEGWRWMQARVAADLDAARAEQRAMDTKLAWAELTRSNVDTFAYLAGETDTHPLIDGAPETVTAADLCGRHLGTTVRSRTYRDSKSRTLPEHLEATYRIENIQHLKNGAILLNGSWPYLRADTVLTVLDPGASATKAA